MKVNKFRIWNYKSIRDSGDCYPSSGVTILAGKNEAGKTSILEALEDFNSDHQIRAKAVPIQDEDSKPKIGIWFKCDKKSIQEIFNTIGHTNKVSEDFVEVYFEKNYPNSYTIDDDTSIRLGFSDDLVVVGDEFQSSVKSSIETIEAILKAHTDKLPGIIAPSPDFSNFSEVKSAYEALKAAVEPIRPNIPEPDSSSLLQHLNSIIEAVQVVLQKAPAKEKFIEEFKNYFPNFILFSSFNDVFPNTIPMSEIEENEWVQDLAVISDLDVTTIKSDNDRKKKDHKTSLNVDFNEEFKKFWVQDLSELSIDWDKDKLYFWIQEDGHHFEPEIRSQGKRWYLAFYVKVTARAKEDFPNVILIDEPGLYLHATAQRDVLNKLEEVSKDAQVFFSTHSPYLIEADKLERIRLVFRSAKKGTIIENKIHKISDKETLTPILTAIGLEMATSISQVDKLNNVIVEGPADYYFLQAFKTIQKEDALNFLYGGGAGNMPKVGTILQGWGCNVVYFYDNDKGYQDAIKNIKSDWVTTTEEMISKIPIQDGSIEDVLSPDDYKQYVLKDSKVKFIISNSDYAKKRDKVLDSKLFLEEVNKGDVTLSNKSLENIENLFKVVIEKFKEEK